MSVGDFPPPPGMVWSDAIGWYRPPCRCVLCTDSFRPVFGVEPSSDFVLSRDAYEKFLDACNNPKPPTQALIDLMREHSPWSKPASLVPNRLMGSTVLENGDAT